MNPKISFRFSETSIQMRHILHVTKPTLAAMSHHARKAWSNGGTPRCPDGQVAEIHVIRLL